MSLNLPRLLAEAKRERRPLAMISLYDAPSATVACDAGSDILLVGDSLGNVILGYDTTIPVSIDDMVRHTGAVVRGARKSTRPDVPVIADLPFGTYATVQDAVANAARLMREGIQAVKLEGAGENTLTAIRILVEMGTPVFGHIGYTPQSSMTLPGVVQGKTAASAEALLQQAHALQEAGCLGMVLEAIPSEVAVVITREMQASTIGIGAGSECDGQVLVWNDLVGLSPGTPFRFVKQFAQTHNIVREAAQTYVAEVHDRTFPTTSHGYTMPDEEKEKWQSK